MDAKIIAVIDAQGFIIENIFFPREFSFVCDDFYVCYEVIPEWTDEEKSTNINQLLNQKHRLHGISYLGQVVDEDTKRAINQNLLSQLICELYWEVKRNDESSIAIKNAYFLKFLESNNFPLFDLDINPIGGELCPALFIFDKFDTNKYCPLHSRTKLQIKHMCVQRKAYSIWLWLSYKILSDKFYDTLY